MPLATNVSADAIMPLVFDAPSEPGEPGSWQAQAYHYARASRMHLGELERKEQYISKLERRIAWYQARLARQKDADTNDADYYGNTSGSRALGGAGDADRPAPPAPRPTAHAGAPSAASRQPQAPEDSLMFWIMKPTTDLQGRARVAIVNAGTGRIVDLYWPELEHVALGVINAYNSTMIAAKQLEKLGLFATAA